MNYTAIDKSWTLFLDRDGVINGERKDEYVLRLDEFIFFDGVLQALKILNDVFSLIIIITNQKGVGKRFQSQFSGLVGVPVACLQTVCPNTACRSAGSQQSA